MGLFTLNDNDTTASHCSVFVVESEQAHLIQRRQDFSVVSRCVLCRVVKCDSTFNVA